MVKGITMATGHDKQRKSPKINLSLNLQHIVNDINSSDDNRTPEYPLQEDHPLAIVNKRRLQAFNFSDMSFPTSSRQQLNSTWTSLQGNDPLNETITQNYENSDSLRPRSGHFDVGRSVCGSHSKSCLNTLFSKTPLQTRFTLGTDCCCGRVTSERCYCDEMALQALNLEAVCTRRFSSTYLEGTDWNKVRCSFHSGDVSNDMRGPFRSKAIPNCEIDEQLETSFGRSSNPYIDKNNNDQDGGNVPQIVNVFQNTDENLCIHGSNQDSQNKTVPSTPVFDKNQNRHDDEEDCNKSPPFLLRVDQSDTSNESSLLSPSHILPPTLSPVIDAKLNSVTHQKFDSKSQTALNLEITIEETSPILGNISPLNGDGHFHVKPESTREAQTFNLLAEFVKVNENKISKSCETGEIKAVSDENVTPSKLLTVGKERIDAKDFDIDEKEYPASEHKRHPTKLLEKSILPCEEISVPKSEMNTIEIENCIPNVKNESMITENADIFQTNQPHEAFFVPANVAVNEMKMGEPENSLHLPVYENLTGTKMSDAIPKCSESITFKVSEHNDHFDEPITPNEERIIFRSNYLSNDESKLNFKHDPVYDLEMNDEFDCNRNMTLLCDHENRGLEKTSVALNEVNIPEDVSMSDDPASNNSSFSKDNVTIVCLPPNGNSPNKQLSDFSTSTEELMVDDDLPGTETEQCTNRPTVVVKDKSTNHQIGRGISISESSDSKDFTFDSSNLDKEQPIDSLSTNNIILTIDMPHAHAILPNQDEANVTHKHITKTHGQSLANVLGANCNFNSMNNSSESLFFDVNMESSNVDDSSLIINSPSEIMTTRITHPLLYGATHNKNIPTECSSTQIFRGTLPKYHSRCYFNANYSLKRKYWQRIKRVMGSRFKFKLNFENHRHRSLIRPLRSRIHVPNFGSHRLSAKQKCSDQNKQSRQNIVSKDTLVLGTRTDSNSDQINHNLPPITTTSKSKIDSSPSSSTIITDSCPPSSVTHLPFTRSPLCPSLPPTSSTEISPVSSCSSSIIKIPTSVSDEDCSPMRMKCMKSTSTQDATTCSIVSTKAMHVPCTQPQLNLPKCPPPITIATQDVTTLSSGKVAVVIESPLSNLSRPQFFHKRTIKACDNTETLSNSLAEPYTVASGYATSPIICATSTNSTNSDHPTLECNSHESGNDCVPSDIRLSIYSPPEVNINNGSGRSFHKAVSPTPSEDDELLSFMSTYIRPVENLSARNEARERYTPPTEIAMERKIELCTLEKLASQENGVVERTHDKESNTMVIKVESPTFLNEPSLISVEEEVNDVCTYRSKSPVVQKQSKELPLTNFFSTKPDNKSYSSLARASIQSKTKSRFKKKLIDFDDEDVLRFLSKKDLDRHALIVPDSVAATFERVRNGEVIDLTSEDLNQEILSISSDDENDSDEMKEIAWSENSEDRLLTTPNDSSKLLLTKTVNVCSNDKIKDDIKVVICSENRSTMLNCDSAHGLASHGVMEDYSTEIESKPATVLTSSKDTVKSLADHIKRRALKMSLEKKAEVSAKIHSIMIEKSELLPESMRAYTIPPNCNNPWEQNFQLHSSTSLNETNTTGVVSLNQYTNSASERKDVLNSLSPLATSDAYKMQPVIPDSITSHSLKSLPNKSEIEPSSNAKTHVSHNHTAENYSQMRDSYSVPMNLFPAVHQQGAIASPSNANFSVMNTLSALDLSTGTTTENYRTVWYSRFIGENTSGDELNTVKSSKSRTRGKGRHSYPTPQKPQSKMSDNEIHDPLLQKLQLLHAAKVIDPEAVRAGKSTEPAQSKSEKSAVIEVAPFGHNSFPKATNHSYQETNPKPVDLSLPNKIRVNSLKQTSLWPTSEHDVNTQVIYSKSPTDASREPTINRNDQNTKISVPNRIHHNLDNQLTYSSHQSVGTLPNQNSSRGILNFEQSNQSPYQIQAPKSLFPKSPFKNPLTQVVLPVNRNPANVENVSLPQIPRPVHVSQTHETMPFDNNRYDFLEPRSSQGILHFARPVNGTLENTNGALVFKPTEIFLKHKMNKEYVRVPLGNSVPRMPYQTSTHIQQPKVQTLVQPFPLNSNDTVIQQYRSSVVHENSPLSRNHIMPSCQNHGNGSCSRPHPSSRSNTPTVIKPQFYCNDKLPQSEPSHNYNPSSKEHTNPYNIVSQNLANYAKASKVSTGEDPVSGHYYKYPSLNPSVSSRHVHSVPYPGSFPPILAAAFNSERPPEKLNHPFTNGTLESVMKKCFIDSKTLQNRNMLKNMRPELFQGIYPGHGGVLKEHELIKTVRLDGHSFGNYTNPSTQKCNSYNNETYPLSNEMGLIPNNIVEVPRLTTAVLDPVISTSEVNNKKRKPRTKQQTKRYNKKMRVDSEMGNPDGSGNLVIDESVNAEIPILTNNNHFSVITAPNKPIDMPFPAIATVIEDLNTANGTQPIKVVYDKSQGKMSPPSDQPIRRETAGPTTVVIRDSNVSNATNAMGNNMNTAVRNFRLSNQQSPMSPNENNVNDHFVGAQPHEIESRSDSGFSDSPNIPDRIPIDRSDLEYVMEEYEENGMKFVSFKPLENQDGALGVSGDIKLETSATDLDKSLQPVDRHDLKAVSNINKTILPVQVDTFLPSGLSSLILASQQIENNTNVTCRNNPPAKIYHENGTKLSTMNSEKIKNFVVSPLHSHELDDEERQIVNLLTSMQRKRSENRQMC